MKDRRTVNELSLAELEQILLTRRREERMRRLRERGIDRELPEPVPASAEADTGKLPTLPRRSQRAPAEKEAPSIKARLLTVIEVTALISFLVVGALWYWEARQTDLSAAEPPVDLGSQEVEAATTEQEQTLPGRPTPPAEAGAIPPIYQDWIQPASEVSSVPLGREEKAGRPARIVIPKLDLDAPVVPGTDWEALKRGVGHQPGTANPGERGNMVVSAHNDLFGQLFRHLHKLEPGDEFSVFDAEQQEYRYVVRTKRIVEPTEVGVIEPTNEAIATLITCHPYPINNQRLVLHAALKR